ERWRSVSRSSSARRASPRRITRIRALPDSSERNSQEFRRQARWNSCEFRYEHERGASAPRSSHQGADAPARQPLSRSLQSSTRAANDPSEPAKVAHRMTDRSQRRTDSRARWRWTIWVCFLLLWSVALLTPDPIGFLLRRAPAGVVVSHSILFLLAK